MWYEWLIIGIAWALIPIVLVIKNKQEERFRKYQEEDQETIRKEILKWNKKKLGE